MIDILIILVTLAILATCYMLWKVIKIILSYPVKSLIDVIFVSLPEDEQNELLDFARNLAKKNKANE